MTAEQEPLIAHKDAARVLVIDDEPEIRQAVRLGLESKGFQVEWSPTGIEGMDRIARWHPDVVLLDLSLPDMDGIEVCRQVRTWSPVPIIILSVREQDHDKVTALESGADDYLTKPFSLAELSARVRVALRHAARHESDANSTQIQAGEILIELDRRRVSVSGQEVHLTPTEYEVLKYLASHIDRAITHQTLLRAVWGPQYADEVHYLRVCIGQLRRKLEADPARPRFIITEPGIGYRFRGE